MPSGLANKKKTWFVFKTLYVSKLSALMLRKLVISLLQCFVVFGGTSFICQTRPSQDLNTNVKSQQK